MCTCEQIIRERLERLRRQYKLDSNMTNYYRIQELQLVLSKMRKEESGRPKPNSKTLPKDDVGGVSGFD